MYDANLLYREAYISGYRGGQKDLTERACEYITHYCNRTGISPTRRAEFITKFREIMETEI